MMVRSHALGGFVARDRPSEWDFVFFENPRDPPVHLFPGPAGRHPPAQGEDGAKMYEWFDRVGYTFDRAALRREFPEVPFHDFESWAKAQDWKTHLQSA